MSVIDDLVRRLDAAPDPNLRLAARDLVQAMLDMHGAALSRMMEMTDAAGEPGGVLIDQFGADPLVSQMLCLHGLHPVDLEVRVRQALDSTRPYLKSHGGDVHIVSVDGNGTVRLKLEGSCHGCPSSQATLESAIEEAIYNVAPDVTAIVLEGAEAPRADAVAVSGFVPIGALRHGPVDRSAQ